MSATGQCPRCGRPGPIGTPCQDDACARLGVHRLPEAFAAEPTDDPIIGRRVDVWLVLGHVGRGGVGDVYLAEQQPVGLRGALKLLTPADSPLSSPERFLREAAALARLGHPNIVRLLSSGIYRGQPYLVMEYVDGARTLGTAAPTLETADTHRILVQMTHALEAAHAADVVHRDLKPANVMLQAVAGEPHFVRLVDFGLAKFTDEDAQTTIIAGSPAYLAPEQVTQEPIGPWTDLYALGVIACELLTGVRPFPGASARAVLLAKSEPDSDPITTLGVPVSAPLAAFLRRAMARHPDGRFASAADMRAALGALDLDDAPRLLATAPMQDPTPPPRSNRSGRFALGGTAAAAALVLGVGIWPAEPDPAPGDARSARVTPPADARPIDAHAVDARVVDARVDVEAMPTVDASTFIADGAPNSQPDARPPVDAANAPVAPTRRRRAQPRPAHAAPKSDMTPDAGRLKMDPGWTKESR